MSATRAFADLCSVVAAQTQGVMKAGRVSGLSNEAACLAALIGVLSVIRVDGLNEEQVLKTARAAVPKGRASWSVVSQ